MKAHIVYKICDRRRWEAAEKVGRFSGAEIDIEDGFIHFSTADQLPSTLALHFKGRNNLVLVAVDAVGLGEEIFYEEARGGTLFPHLYQPLSMKHVLWVKPLPLDKTGVHIIPGPGQ